MKDRQTDDNNQVVKVRLLLLSRLPHNRLIVTGFHELNKQGKIELTIIEDYERGLELPCEGLTEAVINDNTIIAFDTMDGYNYDTKRMDDYLDRVDYCFKRSFSKEKNQLLFPKNSKKIYPLSFNYDVSYLFNPMDYYHSIKDVLILGRKLIRRFEIRDYENASNNLSNIILFMCRLWDPCSNEVVSDKKAQIEREKINRIRIDVIRSLKEKYGKQFIGGIFDDEYARRICPDLVLDKKLTRKKCYLALMKKCGICIATTGLHNSIGWKFAEYVAAGKAIISEPLHYDVSGEFLAGKNYLVFCTAEECINQVQKIVLDSNMKNSIAKANRDYYNNFERPDMQIHNALTLVKNNKE